MIGHKLVVYVINSDQQCLTNSLPKGTNWKPATVTWLPFANTQRGYTRNRNDKGMEMRGSLKRTPSSPTLPEFRRKWCTCTASPYQTTYFASKLLRVTSCQLPKRKKWMVDAKVSNCEGSDHSKNSLPITSLLMENVHRLTPRASSSE